ncbi:MAG: hypothetical protein P4L49_07720 [Desulfosporosinus sp.]|nr:hypothetical protein [Desulfosporosinus sp.]
MPTITVTDELINIIKTERKQREFKSNELSSNLKKNTSFISQLENGKIKQLDLDVFFKIFETLIPDERNRSEFVNDLLKKLSVKLTDDEIKKQLWMATFDLQYRLIVVPEEIIQFLIDKIDMLKLKNFTTKDIINLINLNEGLDELQNLKENQVYAETDNGELVYSIKFKLEGSLIDNIINKNQRKINYINLLGIINAIFKLEGYTREESVDLSKQILYENKFYTLIERDSIIKRKNRDLLSEPDQEFIKLKDMLLNRIDFLGNKDVEYINKRLSVLLNNLKDEVTLTLAVIGVPLVDLNEVDISVKKKFICEFKEMIQKYKNLANNVIIERID